MFFALANPITVLKDNLSKTLQKDKMSAVIEQGLAHLRAKIIQSMRSNSDFDLFHQTVSKKAKRIDDLNEPVMPRKLHQSIYSILQFERGQEKTSDVAEPYYPTTDKEHFKAIHFETIDAVHNTLKERFEQPSFYIFFNVEQTILKSINSESY